MNPPTKFALMRAGRARAARMPEPPASVFTKLLSGEYHIAPPPAPAAPTMEIDGVRYKEAPEINVCEGCALRDGTFGCGLPGGWNDDNLLTAKAFGGGCMNRMTIYIRADAP